MYSGYGLGCASIWSNLYKWIPPFGAALCLHLQGGYRCGKLYGQVTKKVHMMWGEGGRLFGPVEVVHGKCVTDRKWLSSGLKIVVTRGSWKHEEKGKGRTDLFLSLSLLWLWKRLSPPLFFMLIFHVPLQCRSFCLKTGYFESPHYLSYLYPTL